MAGKKEGNWTSRPVVACDKSCQRGKWRKNYSNEAKIPRTVYYHDGSIQMIRVMTVRAMRG